MSKMLAARPSGHPVGVTTPTYNLADLFELVVDAVGDREAMVAGDRRLIYGQLEDRSNRLAHHLAGLGVGEGDHVGLQLMNGTEYAEGMLACFKIRAVPINVNFRYVTDELRHLFDDGDIVVNLTNAQFADRVNAVRADVPQLREVIVVEDDYEDRLAAASPERDFGPRSSNDLYCAYTGGTTGLPKGVIWRHEDIFFAGMGGGDTFHAGNYVMRPEEIVERLPDPGLVALATPPFMHVSAHWLLFSLLFGGGKMVVTPGGRFDPEAIWKLVTDEGVNMLIIVGDAMARPLAEELEANRDSYVTSTLLVVGSGGAVLSPSTKERFSNLLPSTMIVDGYGSSETGTMGRQATVGGQTMGSARFDMGETTRVLDEGLRPIEPGSDEIGRLARRGHVPLRYHKDPEKTEKTIVEIDGVRWVLPGDYAKVAEDGTIELLGRGSVSINTGGEKVYPEEVEAVVKGHPDVFDAVVVGVPDERWGERVVAVVKPVDPARPPTIEAIQDVCRSKLAGYKVPRDICLVDEIVRSPAGKTDYRWAKETAASAAR
jgi:3-oxocholest-4-en-26-oate---CoA ligase